MRNNYSIVFLSAMALSVPALSATWQFDQPLPNGYGPRFGNSAVTGPDGRIYVIGGTGPYLQDPHQFARSNVLRYNPTTNTWDTTLPSITTARTQHAAVVGCDGKIVVIGGTDFWDKALNSVEAYDTATPGPLPFPAMPRAHKKVIATVGPDCNIYAVTNDADPNTGLVQTEIFDRASNQWIANPPTLPMQPCCEYGAVTTHDGRIFVLSDYATFQYSNGQWQDVSDSFFQGPGEAVETAAFGIDGLAYAFGAASMYPMNFPNTSYPAQISTPSHGNSFAVTTAEGRMYVVGGGNTSAVASYGPMLARLQPARTRWNFQGAANVGSGACTLSTYSSLFWGTGKVGTRAAKFNGGSSFTAPAACTDITTGDFSIDFWMQPDGTAAPFAVQSILDKRSGSYRGYHVYFYNNLGAAGGTVGLQLADGGWTNYGTNVAIPKNEWTHVAISVRRGPNGGKIWVNGVLATQFTPTNGSLTSTAALNIGGHNYSPSASFRGQVDELAIYDRALTFQEVRSVFLAGSQGKQ